MDRLPTYHFLQKLTSFPFIEEIWLYGSRARGDHHDRSDIDLALLCPNATEEEWLTITKLIEEADTLLKIDLIRFDQLKVGDKLKTNIEAYKKVLYKKDNRFMEKVMWQDYFESLGKALKRLEEVFEQKDFESNTFLQDAAIQRFEFCIELYWKVLKKFLSYEKVESTTPRDVLQKAYQFKLIDDEKIWLLMMDDRNKTSHVYKEELAKEVLSHLKEYLPILSKTYKNLQDKFYQS